MAPETLWASDIQPYFKDQIVARVLEYDKPHWVLEFCPVMDWEAMVDGVMGEDA
ncbi:hypothetical protein [Eubacterium aggregans]|uniref:hypothetical protein n=1 Tax=Eubacterium aggregans TaxID=81409 RepID=UPI003F34ECA8